jgi:hypothetical protein
MFLQGDLVLHKHSRRLGDVVATPQRPDRVIVNWRGAPLYVKSEAPALPEHLIYCPDEKYADAVRDQLENPLLYLPPRPAHLEPN